MNEKPAILTEVCRALSAGDTEGARDILKSRYPFEPVQIERPGYSRTRMMTIFKADGFLDRYSGSRLICPGALLTISHFLKEAFPIHRNWKTDATHFAYYAHWPVLDHIEPVSRGGVNSDNNLVTTSTLRNSAKANFTLAELGWELLPRRIDPEWDWLVGWFVEITRAKPEILNSDLIKSWHAATAA